MKRARAMHYGATLDGPLACGAQGDFTADPAHVTCKNCKRSAVILGTVGAELVEFVASFHENPNIDACPECLPAVAEILDANPDAEPADLDLPHCDFCDDLRLVYVQRAAETTP